jgi:hypothetical protein
MEANWERNAKSLAEQLASTLSAELERKRLSEKLVEFRLEPRNPDGATVILVVSPHEVIVSSGLAARLELEALPASAERASEIARAVARGGLQEQVWHGVVSFQLRLPDGAVLTGRSFNIRYLGMRKEFTYPPYEVERP